MVARLKWRGWEKEKRSFNWVSEGLEGRSSTGLKSIEAVEEKKWKAKWRRREVEEKREKREVGEFKRLFWASKGKSLQLAKSWFERESLARAIKQRRGRVSESQRTRQEWAKKEKDKDNDIQTIQSRPNKHNLWGQGIRHKRIKREKGESMIRDGEGGKREGDRG